MTPADFKAIRKHLGLDEATFAAELGYAGSTQNKITLIRSYERGKKTPIPTYIARLAFMLAEHFDCEEGHLPEWPASCVANPPKANGDRK